MGANGNTEERYDMTENMMRTVEGHSNKEANANQKHSHTHCKKLRCLLNPFSKGESTIYCLSVS